MERSYARALLLAGLTLMGAGFLAFALFEALLPLLGTALAAAVTGILCLVPVLAIALRERKAPPSVAASAASSAVAATSVLEGFAGLLDPAKRRK
ncbi:hypothetical protein D3874_03895 [Oleomonas cavernae]|uniref:Uncharacterized protein n=1 Tax=Oleomonas cavernae TaxID=2320859 RepID=A0A418W8F7_9PROT|nr:hypothetical protein [Oleomonas cavernae]RJF86282.1 hypothetical protein D3874_03895 [Oleomonas cavernae]